MTTFHYLVRGMHITEDSVLLAKEKGSANTFLPGGHIEFGEKAETALRREILEEMGKDSEIGSFVGAIEHMWPDTSLDNHELNLIFNVKIMDVSIERNPISEEPHLEFLWARIQELEKYHLLPSPLVNLIKTGSKPKPGYWASTLGVDRD
jgi:8-oxo-dGTP diphosphatase